MITLENGWGMMKIIKNWIAKRLMKNFKRVLAYLNRTG
jgi:hypothetical protein